MLLLQIMESVTKQELSLRFRKTLATLFIVSLVWSSTMAFGVDLLRGEHVRSYFFNASKNIYPLIKKDVLIMTFQPDYVWGLLESDKSPLIANYTLGSPEESINLIERALHRRPVYWLKPRIDDDEFSRKVLAEVQKRNICVKPLLEISEKLDYSLFYLYRDPSTK